MGNLLAGAAKIDITPTPEILEKSKNESPRHTFEGIYKHTYARIIAVSDGQQKVLLITADLGMIPGQRKIQKRLQETYQIDPLAIVFGATHNHQTIMCHEKGEGPADMAPLPPSGEMYIQYIADRIVEGCGIALQSMVPARMGVGSGSSYLNVCRDCPSPIGAIQAANFHGPSDKELLVVRFDAVETGKPLALLVNFAMHGNVMFGNLLDRSFPYISGDLPGAIAERAEERLDCIVGWAIGAAGDQNPIYTSFVVDYAKDGVGEYTSQMHTLKAEDNLTMLNRMANIQAEEITAISDSISDYTDIFSWSGAETSRTVPARKSYRSLGYEGASKELPPFVEDPDHPVTLIFRLVTLCGCAFAGVNGEIYSNLGKLIKSLLPYPHTFVSEMQFGHVGYIPDAETEKIGGFGTCATYCRSGAETEAAIRDGFSELINHIQP